jgi:hypothetical protein
MPAGALWNVAGSTGIQLTGAMARLTFGLGTWETVPWADSWPTAFGSVLGAPVDAPGGVAAVRLGGCQMDASNAVNPSARVAVFAGGLQAA